MRRLLASIARLWRSTRSLLGVLSLLRFHLLVLAIGLVLVMQVPQVRDLLISYGLDFTPARAGWLTALLLAMELCALTLWYSARVMLRFRFEPPGDGNNDLPPGDDNSDVPTGDDKDDLPSGGDNTDAPTGDGKDHAPPGDDEDRAISASPYAPRHCPSDRQAWPRLKRHLPRLLGGSVFIIFLVGLHSLWRQYPFQPVFLALSVVLAFLVYVAFVRYRRKLFGLPSYEEEIATNNLREFAELPRSTRVVYYLLLLANVAVMAFAITRPLALAAALGPGAVVLIAAGLFVVVGSTFVYWSNWAGVPVVTLTLVLVIGFSLLNENHLVRVCGDMSSHDAQPRCAREAATAAPRTAVEDALDAWVATRAADGRTSLPLIVVATEGGGIRAAWWTAAVLGELQDRAGDAAFADRVFAISGVSGGSLGAAVFAALVSENEQAGAYRERADAMLRTDFLGPTLVTLMFPDLLQRFLPLPLFDDRAVTLERAWEAAWRRQSAGDDAFSAPFVDLWRDSDARVPLLFLNSTVVETGQRLVHGPLLLPDDQQSFLAALDGRRVLGDAVPLSTVVNNSARFTYVSPAGLARRRDVRSTDTRDHWIRLVDGGYFENSAALTAAELMQVVLDQRPRLEAQYGIRLLPYVVRVRNAEAEYDPDCSFATTDSDELASGKTCFRRQLLHESVSPLRALLNVRPAHARLAAAQLREMAAQTELGLPGDGDVGFTMLSLRNNGIVHPLGWALSGESRSDMTCQVVGYDDQRCLRDGMTGEASISDDIDRIVDFLRAAAASDAP